MTEPVLGTGGGGSGEEPWEVPVAVPWSAGFEDGLCGYTRAGGYCYGDVDAALDLVESPVRSGRFAAAFSISSDSELDGKQVRCVREGLLPTRARYGAWYLIPERVNVTGNWNLFHFQGADAGDSLHGLWDVSLRNAEGGGLEPFLRDFMGGVHGPSAPTEIPIGAWFHVEMDLSRASDASGEFALYLDGQLVVRGEDAITDDSEWGQWYVGNLADGLDPSSSTLYVDDVSIVSVP